MGQNQLYPFQANPIQIYFSRRGRANRITRSHVLFFTVIKFLRYVRRSYRGQLASGTVSELHLYGHALTTTYITFPGTLRNTQQQARHVWS